ncbi:MAG: class I tRNA ligase family protein [Mycoplasma sp.]|nr:class I tRNA ligase family protein [Mycoplasma sp.]
MDNSKYVYLCGPTVYNKVHIGNMRPIITFDLILRGLKYIDNNTIFIHNITDIDDKIINQAKLENVSENVISEKYYMFYLDMLKEFNIKTIDIMPKVTEHINDIDVFIKKIINLRFAYETNNSYYFDTSKLKNYGSVSNIKLDSLKENKALEQINSFDFALWKNKIDGQNWNISLGNGRPGWHTECAVFIDKYTNGNSLEIHGGGIDLKFPHHENENAQYEVVNNKSITKSWLHTGTINVNHQKMSKSIGNIINADEFLKMYSDQTNAADLYRLLILTSGISAAIEVNDNTLNPLIKKLNQIEKIINHLILNNIQLDIEKKMIDEIANDVSKYMFASICKKLNYHIKKFNETKNVENGIIVYHIMKFLGFHVANKTIDMDLIKIYQNYREALSKKDFKTSDELRKKLIDFNLI